ncbi:MAG: hypothetical protein ACE5HO_15485, partial [bacterium]
FYLLSGIPPVPKVYCGTHLVEKLRFDRQLELIEAKLPEQVRPPNWSLLGMRAAAQVHAYGHPPYLIPNAKLLDNVNFFCRAYGFLSIIHICNRSVATRTLSTR